MYQQNCKSIIQGVLFCIIITVAGCGGSAELAPAVTSISLAWDAPTTYIDGSGLDPVNEIKEYRIYYRTEAESYTSENRYTVSAPATSVSLTLSSSPDTYYFVITAVDRADMESGFSNEVSRTTN